MISIRQTTLLLAASVFLRSCGLFAAPLAPYFTVYGSNPLERISGPDYAAIFTLGQTGVPMSALGTNIPPGYTSRYGLQFITGGETPPPYPFYKPLNGNLIDPRTGVNYLDNRNAPYLFPYNQVTGVTAGVNPFAAPTPFRANSLSSTDAAVAGALSRAGIRPLTLGNLPAPSLVMLGQALFFDPILSGNRDRSCASCHNPARGASDGLSVFKGGGRNVPALYNVTLADVRSLGWDRRVQKDAYNMLLTPEPALNGSRPTRPDLVAPLTSLAAATALFWVADPAMVGPAGTNELAQAPNRIELWRRLMVRLVGDGTNGGIPAYRTLFRSSFGFFTAAQAANFSYAARALSAYMQVAWLAGTSPLDQYLSGNATALTDSQKLGALLFCGKARCSQCHSGPQFTDFQAHNIVVPQVGPGVDPGGDDLGVARVTGLANDRYRFRTPPLRNATHTGPWMHDGCYVTLEAAVRHHLDPQQSYINYDPRPLDPSIAAQLDRSAAHGTARLAGMDPVLRPAVYLDASEMTNLLAFLAALSDPAAIFRLPSPPASVPSGLPVGGISL
jgi:cytochrome c peroxidase